jgi:two-component system, OmpR family, sensor histidine kinase TctE
VNASGASGKLRSGRSLQAALPGLPSRRSLFSAILSWMLIPLLIALPISLVLTYLIGISLANTAFDRTLASQARALAEQIVWLPRTGAYRMLIDLPTLLSDEDMANHYYRVDDVRGKLIFGTSQLPASVAAGKGDYSPVVFSDEILAAGDDKTIRVRAATLTREINGSKEPISLQIAETTERREALAREITLGVMLPQLILIPLAMFMLWVGLRRGLHPLNRLHEQVARREASDFRPLDAADAPEDVVPLINAFNQMLHRVEQNAIAQKRFIANAAHQLRTPLAGVRMQTELALRSTDPSAMAEALQRIATGSERSTHLINQLLTLARAETDAEGAIRFEQVDLVSLARTGVEEALPLAGQKNIDLGLEADAPSAAIKASPLLAKELIANLIDNALRYTPADGHVTVRVHAGAEITLEVEDNGIGIPAAERQLVFDRFYRAVGSKEPGTGIGLAIVKEIVARHGATIAALSPAGGKGTLMRVVFPAFPA